MKSKFILPAFLFVFGVAGLLAILIRCSFTPIDPIPNESSDITLRVETSVTETTSTTEYITTTLGSTTFYNTTTEITETVVSTNTTTETVGETICETVVSTTAVPVITECEVIETTTQISEKVIPEIHDEFVKTFTHNTYYPDYVNNSMKGGSGRTLIGCDVGEGDIKGSIASRYLYDKFKYNYNGKRTKVYLVVYNYPEMTGYYYLDDCCSAADERLRCNTIDFYYKHPCNCPFYSPIGVAGDIDCYICNY